MSDDQMPPLPLATVAASAENAHLGGSFGALFTADQMCAYAAAAVQAEPDRLKEINRQLVDKCNALTIQSARDEEERDQLRAEVEALRADAERYRWLRHGDNDEEVMVDNGNFQFLPRMGQLDAAIDAARGAK